MEQQEKMGKSKGDREEQEEERDDGREDSGVNEDELTKSSPQRLMNAKSVSDSSKLSCAYLYLSVSAFFSFLAYVSMSFIFCSIADFFFILCSITFPFFIFFLYC
eukprot:GHVT01086816.1.p1 GENE.GHVT01086816.1~~GHVT01086816.1.p1  ORF type:complete len:105 (+),score=8.36 GHVT01086816.1:161-475(+)